jgi:hypothetical protein
VTGHVIDTAPPRRLDGIVRDPALRAAIGYWDSLRGAAPRRAHPRARRLERGADSSSATRKASSSDCDAFRRGSQAVW